MKASSPSVVPHTTQSKPGVGQRESKEKLRLRTKRDGQPAVAAANCCVNKSPNITSLAHHCMMRTVVMVKTRHCVSQFESTELEEPKGPVILHSFTLFVALLIANFLHLWRLQIQGLEVLPASRPPLCL